MKLSKVLAIVIGAMLMHGTASAQQQTKAQQKCINAMNKSMAKVGVAQTKASAKCAKARAKDGTTDFFTCSINDPKVDSAEAKTLEQETKSCTEMPSFGFTGGNNVNNRAQYESSQIAEDLFDNNAGITDCTSDKAGCKCQGKALKAANKLYKAHLKTFNKCKKVGLKDKTAPIIAAAGLDDCVEADPKGKIGKAATKLGSAIDKKCGAVATPFSAGDCASDTGSALTTCVQERVRCHACLTAVLSDGLSLDCDVFDDDDDKNGSCFDDF